MSSTLPEQHAAILENIRAGVKADERILALLAGGSLLHGGFDEFSDLDLVIVVNDASYDEVTPARRRIAESFGPLLAAFTGEHVGEPRLLICLYGPEALHVDFKFITIDALQKMVERPEIIWARDNSVEKAIAAAEISWPNLHDEWFEQRFWIWAHYAATKIGRGELFEAIGMLSFIRDQVLGPLIHNAHGQPQRGVRRIEERFPEDAKTLAATNADHDRESILSALKQAIALYKDLRRPGAHHAADAEKSVTTYIERLS